MDLSQAFSRLILEESRANPSMFGGKLENLASLPPKQQDAALDEAGSALFQRLVQPTINVSSEIGNSYTGSLYATLTGTIMDNDCANKRLLLFSYGSGSAATMFSLVADSNVNSVVDSASIRRAFESRIKIDPKEFSEALERRQKIGASCRPVASPEIMAPGTFYLEQVDELHRRFYAVKS